MKIKIENSLSVTKKKKEAVPSLEDFSIANPKAFEEKYNVLRNLAFTLAEPEDFYLREKESLNFESPSEILQWLREKISSDKNSDNYFLKKYTESVIENKGNVEDLNQAPTDFKIAKGQYALLWGDTIRVSDPESYNAITKLFSESEDVGKERRKCEEGSREEDDYMLEEQAIDSRIESLISEKLKVEDVVKSKVLPGDKTDFKYFSIFSQKGMRDVIEKQFNIQMKELSLPEQFRFLQYIKNHTVENMKPVEKFSQTFKESGIKTFLSIEHGGREMGDKILTLGEKLPKEVAEKVFAKYGEIVDSASEAADFVAKKLSGVNGDQYIGHIQENLLRKGKDLLTNSSERIETCTDEECEDIGKTIIEELAHLKREILLFASTFKALSDTEGVKLGDIKDTTIEVTNNQSVIQKYQTEMERIFEDNRKSYPDELKQKSLNEFKEALAHPENSEFYILKNVEDVVAFMRFDTLPNGNLYAGSLNSRNEIHGLAVGGALLKELLDEKAKTNTIEAVVYSKNPMLRKYTSEYKFEIAGEIPNYEGTGELFYKIIRTKE